MDYDGFIVSYYDLWPFDLGSALLCRSICIVALYSIPLSVSSLCSNSSIIIIVLDLRVRQVRRVYNKIKSST